jgi:hypothetical protein
MPKAPRDQESATPSPKKRTRKTATKPENGVHVGDGNGASVQSVTVPPVTADAQVPSNVEDKIRFRAYQLYLERGGKGGSPEQDWFRAQQEICGRGTAA